MVWWWEIIPKKTSICVQFAEFRGMIKTSKKWLPHKFIIKCGIIQRHFNPSVFGLYEQIQENGNRQYPREI